MRDAQNTTVELTGGEVNVYDAISITSVTPESESIVAGHSARWIIATDGGKGTLAYDYQVYRGEDLIYSEQNQTSNVVDYVPMHSGSYTVKVVAKDENGEMAEAAGTAITVADSEVTPVEYFTIQNTSGNFATITGYTGTDTAVVIPAQIGEYTITSIGSDAFKNNTTLISVSMPDTLETIGSYAFYKCTNLKAVVIPVVETVESSAFADCKNLKTIELPEGTKTIGEEAFSGCTSFTSIYLPDSIEEIGQRAFSGCVKLSEINIPLSWTAAGSSIFSGCESLRSITVPEGITALPSYAFSGATYLTDISMPSTLTTIGSLAFYNCTGIEKIYISPNVTSIGSEAFTGATNVKIYCEYGSCALQYAINNSIPYYFLSLVSYSLPYGTLYQGDDNHIYGMIRSSDPIINAEVKLYDATGAVLRSGSIANSATLINLNVSLDGYISLSTLPVGSYSIEVSASTEEETEIFARSSFTIAPPPLRAMIIGANLPNGLYDIGTAFQLQGVIQSNYAISSITAGIYDKAGVASSKVVTVTPYTTSYDLANLASTADISDLTDGKYEYRISIVSNGQTIKLKSSSFGMGTADGDGITDKELAQVLVFGSNMENKYAFDGLNYHDEYLNSLDTWDAFTVALISGSEIVSQKLTDVMFGVKYDSYAVELYKSQICEAIEDLTKTIEIDSSDLKLYKTVSGWVASWGDIAHTSYKDYLQALEKEYGALNDVVTLKNYDYCISAATYAGLSQFGEMVDDLKLVKDSIATLSDITEVLELMLKDYETGTQILDIVATTIGETSNPNFNEAMRQVRIEYNSQVAAVNRKLLTEVKKKIGKESIKQILKFVGGGTYKIYSLVSSILLEVSGLKDYANNIMDFAAASEAYNHAYRAYVNAFNRVYKGDQSEEALRALLICFNYTYACADNLYHILYKISPDSKKAVVVAQMNVLGQISIWN